MLQSITVLLVTFNTSEAFATRSYLKPLDFSNNIYLFVDKRRQSTNGHVIYHIGKYGVCPAAVIEVSHSFKLNDHTVSISMMANQCFPNLGAIINVGVIVGMKSKVKMCDVLVSSQVDSYNKDEHGEINIQTNEGFTVSPRLVKLFNQFVQWPSDEFRKRLSDNGVPLPNVKSGLILIGQYLFADSTMEDIIKNLGPKAIGVEMETANFFAETEKSMTNVIIIKAVCGFADGNKSTEYHPTAALLAADLVYKHLSNSKSYEILKGLCKLFSYLLKDVHAKLKI